MDKFQVGLGQRSYPIIIGENLLTQIDKLLDIDLNRKIFIITDENLAKYYADSLKTSLPAKNIYTHVIKAGEASKSFENYEKCCNFLLSNGVNRKSLIIALGGGVVGDIAGFTASTILRGIDFIQIPTSLLSQVDSSVGGKTGINTKYGKNLIGSFYQPKAVICDINTLKTLPERELKSGYAEIIKYGLINNPSFFDWLNENGNNILSLDYNSLCHAILTSCKSKAKIVEEDEKETGKRALLNLGHTFAHALEAICGYNGTLLHGEAVSIGMVLAFELSGKMGICPVDDIEKVKNHITSCGLVSKISDINTDIEFNSDKLYELMKFDKKATDNAINFILVKGIGKSFITNEANKKDILEILDNSIAN